MSNVKYGVTDWESVEIKTGNPNAGRRDIYMKLLDGDNIIRVVSKPFEYLVHEYKPDPKAPGYGIKIKSSLASCGKDVLMDRNPAYKPQRRWLIAVIDRRTQSLKILEFKSTVFKSIQTYVRDPDYQNPEGYDLNIKVDKSAKGQGYYTVFPKPRKPLSPSDLELKQQVDLEDLKKRTLPPTYEEMEELVRKAESKFSQTTNFGQSQNNEASTSSSSGEETEDFEFPTVPGSDK
jgi:hypothetical protein